MSCFLLLKHFSDDLNIMIASFWWSGNEGEKKCIDVLGKSFVYPSRRAVLGFEISMLSILVCLPKWARDCWLIPPFWLLPSSKQSISPIHTSLRPLSNQVHPTARRAIFALPRKVIMVSYRWKVGDGHPIMIWEDPWILTPFSIRLFSPKPLGWNVSAVSDLNDPFSKSWRHDIIQTLFTGSEAESIRSIPLSIHSS